MRIRSSKSRTSGQNHDLKFGMVGTYKSYFRNVKTKGKVIFYHSTTLIRNTEKSGRATMGAPVLKLMHNCLSTGGQRKFKYSLFWSLLCKKIHNL